jgi:hypothetical protein
VKATAFKADIDAASARTQTRITTMTVQFTLRPTTFIPLTYFKAAFADPEAQDSLAGFFGTTATVTMKATGERSRAFSNCLLFHHKEGQKTTALKLFCNGTLHITGFADIDPALGLAKAFAAFLAFLTNVPFEVHDFEVQLVNASFRIEEGRGICLVPMYEHVLKQTEYVCRYNQEVHAGLIIQMLFPIDGDGLGLHKVSVIVFDTGNILISAFVTGRQLTEAHAFITGLLEAKPEFTKEVETGVKRRRRQCRGEEFDYGAFLLLK